MQQALLVVQVLVAVALIAVVLLQQGRGADAGAAFGSGGAGTLFGARGPATLLTRATAVLAAAFFINSIALSYLATQTVDRRSVVERYEQAAPADDTTAPEAGPLADIPVDERPDAPVGPSDVPTLPSDDGTPSQ